MMDRSDYETLASSIVEADVPDEHKRTLALEIATGLCATNARFDPRRFLDQCSVSLSLAEAEEYSHALYLRLRTGVGAERARLGR